MMRSKSWVISAWKAKDSAGAADMVVLGGGGAWGREGEEEEERRARLCVQVEAKEGDGN